MTGDAPPDAQSALRRGRGSGGDRLRLPAEAVRKVIHLATLGVPVLVWFLPRPAAVGLLAVGLLGALVVEWARTRLRWARHLFLSRTRRLLRHHERHRFAGATYMAAAYLAVYLLLPMPLAVLAMLYAALGDASAALVGKRWGRHRASWGKSWEGAAAGFTVNLGAGLALPGVPLAVAGVGAATAATLEFLPLPLDDNLRVTLGGGLAAWAAFLLTSAA